MAVVMEGVVRHFIGCKTMTHTATSSASDASPTVSAMVTLNPNMRNSLTSPIACGSLGAAATRTCRLGNAGCDSCPMVVGLSYSYNYYLYMSISETLPLS